MVQSNKDDNPLHYLLSDSSDPEDVPEVKQIRLVDQGNHLQHGDVDIWPHLHADPGVWCVNMMNEAVTESVFMKRKRQLFSQGCVPCISDIVRRIP